MLFETTIEPDATESVTHTTNPQSRREYLYLLNGGAESADVELEWYGKAPGSDDWFHIRDEDEQNADLTEGETYRPDVRGATEVRLDITNDGNEPIELKTFVSSHRA